ncbi:MAG TPA: methyltransferase domain-containing protein [Candidatus Acidoferrum sp.]|nr:methyltransferase domain-containing protein [Candidatus Acidoferrum sp.]
MPKRRLLITGLLLLVVFVSLCAAISESEIQRLARVMNWKSGQVIADIGAGEGEIGFAAAAAVGETGKVYLTELDEAKVAALGKEASRKKLKNVEVLAAAEKETKLPDNCCDAIVLRRVYHHFTAPNEMDASLMRSLRRGGLLAVIEFAPRKSLSASDPVKGVPSNRGGHGIPKKILLEELTAAGLKLDKTFDDWPEDGYCVLFRKP